MTATAPFGPRPGGRHTGLTAARILLGGAPDDAGRLPRYLVFVLLGLAAIWAPIHGYLSHAPLRYTSEASLILPGAGGGSTLTLDQIGQANSASSSPFANSSISPTVTYKRLLGAGRILETAARKMDIAPRDFGEPRVKLVDQTGLIRIEMEGTTPEDARARARAVLGAFEAEVDALRADEIAQRSGSGADAVTKYREAVSRNRARISALQRDTGLMSYDQYEDLVASADDLARRRDTLAARLEDRAETVASLEAALGTTPARAAATLRLHADSAFAALVEQMAEFEAELARMDGDFGPNHPRVTEKRAALEATSRRAMARARALTDLPDAALARLDLSPIGQRAELLSDLVSAETKRAALAAEHETVRAQAEAARRRVEGLIDAAAELEALQRDYSVAEAVFASGMARADTARSDIYVSYPLVQVLEDPSLPAEPSSPRRVLALAAGAAASVLLVLALGLGWVRGSLINRLLARPGAQR
jgi:uncharacterized protein involved in exopolysaccharide biosynthesis